MFVDSNKSKSVNKNIKKYIKKKQVEIKKSGMLRTLVALKH